jgi:hypothetical protein
MSRQNHNAQYIYDFEGETPWEKLRAVRNQLKQRKLAFELTQLNKEKVETTLDKNSFEYREYLLNKEQTEENIQDCVNEIKFLTEFESALAVEAEKTRIPGKTDDEMYEINFFDELKLRLVRQAQSQILSSGRLAEETARRILKHRPALQLCIEQGLLSENALQIANVNTSALPNNYEVLHLENLKKENQNG